MQMNRTSAVSRRVWKWVEVAVAIIGVSLALSSAELWMHYAYTRPTIPNSGIGRIYSLNTHGSVVYLNSHEQSLLNSLMIVGGAFFVGAVAIDLLKKPFRSTE